MCPAVNDSLVFWSNASNCVIVTFSLRGCSKQLQCQLLHITTAQSDIAFQKACLQEMDTLVNLLYCTNFDKSDVNNDVQCDCNMGQTIFVRILQCIGHNDYYYVINDCDKLYKKINMFRDMLSLYCSVQAVHCRSDQGEIVGRVWGPRDVDNRF